MRHWGTLDAFLEAEQIPRIAGPHCYEMFLGKVAFEAEMETSLGTFFLTDYMVRHFERIVMRGMGIANTPSCVTRILDITHGCFTSPRPIAKRYRLRRLRRAELGLDYEYRYVGYGEFTDFIHGLPHRTSLLKTKKGSAPSLNKDFQNGKSDYSVLA